MADVHCLQHAAHEAAGRLETVFAQAGLSLRTHRLDAGEALPEPGEGRLWLVMGGPMGVGDLGNSQYPFLAPEAAALRTRLARRLPILGICLGAQLLAHAAGARVYPNQQVLTPGGTPEPAREVGWAPVRLHGADEPAHAGLGETLEVLHWHGDTFDLPVGAVHLASTPRCAHQAFRLGHHAYGLQFHPEVEPAQVATWIAEDAPFIRRARGEDGPAQVRRETASLASSVVPRCTQYLTNILRAQGLIAS